MIQVGRAFHPQNRIAGQFCEPIPYENLPSDTAEALGDTTPEKLRILLANIEQARTLAFGDRPTSVLRRP